MNKINYFKGLSRRCYQPVQHSPKKPILYNKINPFIKVFDQRWNGEISKEEFKTKLDSLKGNVDSHDNSLYHESLYEKKNNYSKHSIQSIVDDYNKRWKKSLTVEEYYDNFK